MTKIITYCDECENEIKTTEYRYSISWEDKYFSNTTGIVLCKECAIKFQTELLGCKWSNMEN